MRLAVLVSGVVGGLRRRRPPAMSLISLTQLRRRPACGFALDSGRGVHSRLVSGFPARFYSLRSFRCPWSSWLRGARLSSAPPPSFTFPVQPYLSQYPPYKRESIFVVVPLALSPSVPPGLGPVDLLIAFRAPFRIPPSPFLCHARRPPLLALKRHRAVIMWAVPNPEC